MSKKKFASSLAKDHELGSNDRDFYQYIIDSLANGQRSQVRSLFNSMHKDSQQDFLINFLDKDQNLHLSVLNICIIELTN